MRISRVAHVAERYFSRGKPRKVRISTIADVTQPWFFSGENDKNRVSMIADVTQPWFFSGERAESISGRSRTLSGASPPKIQKKSGAKKTSVFSVLLCQNIQFFVASAPDHFCWIFGRLGFDSFLKGSTLFFHERKREKCDFRGSLT